MQSTATALSMCLVLVVVLAGVGAATTPTASTAAISGEEVAQTATGGNCSFPVTRTDATGAKVTLKSEPQRIVTLSPSAAQTLWEIGAKGKVVGLTKYAAYLDGAEKRTNISGSGMQYANVEEVVGLEPDLVLAPNVIPNATVRKLRSAGVTVFKFEEAKSIADVSQKTRLTGRLVGACAGADTIATAMNRRVAAIREAIADKPAPRVLFYLGGS
ncbi:MAG TPA: ABC transporter substrate-binding protein, partial [Halococcus sp.]|nr:ABC transporter substrate-binding protein [Halococcus sp.]